MNLLQKVFFVSAFAAQFFVNCFFDAQLGKLHRVPIEWQQWKEYADKRYQPNNETMLREMQKSTNVYLVTDGINGSIITFTNQDPAWPLDLPVSGK